jgi:hypothetical protein
MAPKPRATSAIPKWPFVIRACFSTFERMRYFRRGMASSPLASPCRGAAPLLGSPGSGSLAGGGLLCGATTPLPVAPRPWPRVSTGRSRSAEVVLESAGWPLRSFSPAGAPLGWAAAAIVPANRLAATVRTNLLFIRRPLGCSPVLPGAPVEGEPVRRGPVPDARLIVRRNAVPICAPQPLAHRLDRPFDRPMGRTTRMDHVTADTDQRCMHAYGYPALNQG